jgi:DNA polymerase
MSAKDCIKGRRYAEGPSNAAVMLVGQNPGREEVRRGRPFVGRAGRYLDAVLQKNGLARDELYLTAVVKEPTPNNRKPRAAEIRAWMPCLEAEIERIRPAVILLMGRVAWETPRRDGIDYIETYHPAAAMRFPDIRQTFERDLAKLGRKMKKEGLPGVS